MSSVRPRDELVFDPSPSSGFVAALEAWGASRNLFHQGFAKESDDSEVIGSDYGKAWSGSAAPGWVE